jgi:hypothetical protein
MREREREKDKDKEKGREKEREEREHHALFSVNMDPRRHGCAALRTNI